MIKIDFKKTYPELYRPSDKDFALVVVPAMQFAMVDGQGAPNTEPSYKQAIEWLFSVSYAMKFAAKASLNQDYVVPPLESFRLDSYEEGLSFQILHIGDYNDEGPILARLHDELMPSQGFGFAGKHHEIYLSDARKTETSKLKTILRQPVRRLP